MIRVKHSPMQAAPLCKSGVECVPDQSGAHVVRDGPAGQFAGVAGDHGGQVQVPAPAQGQVGDVDHVTLVRRGGGEIPLQQVGKLLIGRFRGPWCEPFDAT